MQRMLIQWKGRKTELIWQASRYHNQLLVELSTTQLFHKNNRQSSMWDVPPTEINVMNNPAKQGWQKQSSGMRTKTAIKTTNNPMWHKKSNLKSNTIKQHIFIFVWKKRHNSTSLNSTQLDATTRCNNSMQQWLSDLLFRLDFCDDGLVDWVIQVLPPMLFERRR